jgi:hypothetical protein
MKYFTLIVFMFSYLTMAATLEGPKPLASRHVDLLAAMCEVESNCDSTKVGEDDEIGMYQILPPYWQDALEHDPTIGGVYEDVLNKQYAERIILTFWDRYATEKRLGRPVTDEDRARMHNKGPNGYKKDSSIPYWNKVEKILNE